MKRLLLGGQVSKRDDKTLRAMSKSPEHSPKGRESFHPCRPTASAAKWPSPIQRLKNSRPFASPNSDVLHQQSSRPDLRTSSAPASTRRIVQSINPLVAIVRGRAVHLAHWPEGLLIARVYRVQPPDTTSVGRRSLAKKSEKNSTTIMQSHRLQYRTCFQEGSHVTSYSSILIGGRSGVRECVSTLSTISSTRSLAGRASVSESGMRHQSVNRDAALLKQLRPDPKT